MQNPPTETTDPIGVAIIELRDLDDINDHISMRGILGKIVEAERQRCARIARNNMDEWNTAGWDACAEEILREIQNG